MLLIIIVSQSNGILVSSTNDSNLTKRTGTNSFATTTPVTFQSMLNHFIYVCIYNCYILVVKGVT